VSLAGVMTGTEKPQAAFMSGKIKFKVRVRVRVRARARVSACLVQGAMPLVMKLGKLSGEAKL
jgi:hypothetical protein